MIAADDANLTQFWGLEKDYIRRRDLNRVNWTRSAKAGAVGIYPVGGTSLKPVVDFMFKETGPASGTKAPDNPSTITGVSSVKVTRCGKNLLPRNPISSVMSQRGITVTYNEDGSIHLKGTATSGYDAYMTYFNNASLGVVPVVMAAGKIFTVSVTCSDSNVSGKIYDSNSLVSWGVPVNVSPGTPVTHTMQSNVASAMFRIMVTRGSTVDCDVHCQIEYGQTATEWEAPADTDYTISLGNTYYGGSIDLATGVMTVTQFGVELDGTETGWWTSGTVGTDFKHATLLSADGFPLPTAGATGKVCSHAATYIVSYAQSLGSFFVSDTNNPQIAFADKNAVYPTNDAWKAWLAAQKTAGTPVVVTYPLATPFTVQLSPVQISALAQTDKYTPRLNTIYTDAQAVQVGYVKSPIRKEFELQQAVTALGGNI